MIIIRPERSSDIEEVRMINDLAFGQTQEGILVDALRKNCNKILSLVAVSDSKVIGNIIFSPVVLEGQTTQIIGMGLGPMAVLPEFQNQGIGSKLVTEGINKIKQTGCPFIIVLGHANYYPRFGFERASKYGVCSQWEGVPDEVFMVLVLKEKEMAGGARILKYRDEFNDVM